MQGGAQKVKNEPVSYPLVILVHFCVKVWPTVTIEITTIFANWNYYQKRKWL